MINSYGLLDIIRCSTNWIIFTFLLRNWSIIVKSIEPLTSFPDDEINFKLIIEIIILVDLKVNDKEKLKKKGYGFEKTSKLSKSNFLPS